MKKKICKKCGELTDNFATERSTVCNECKATKKDAVKVMDEKSDDGEKDMTRDDMMSLIVDRNYTSYLPKDREATDDELKEIVSKIPEEKTYKIIIADKEDDTPAAFVQVNGQPPLWIKRGVEVEVKGRVVEALRNAIGYRYISNVSNNNLVVVKKHEEVFQILGEV